MTDERYELKKHWFKKDEVYDKVFDTKVEPVEMVEKLNFTEKENKELAKEIKDLKEENLFLNVRLENTSDELRKLEIEHNNTEAVLNDFMNMLNSLQANPVDRNLRLQARDMLLMMNVLLKE